MKARFKKETIRACLNCKEQSTVVTRKLSIFWECRNESFKISTNGMLKIDLTIYSPGSNSREIKTHEKVNKASILLILPS